MLAGSVYSQAGEKLTKNVDPFIGTGGHGHTFPGATVPFGMVQLSPDTYNEGWDWCSGYHTMISPNIFNDVDGSYWGMDQKVHKSEKGDIYTVFSLWDTFRGLHPLLSIIDRKRTNDFVNTFLHKYNEYGLLPVWELAGWETNCMIGYHSIPVIVDAYMKGIRDYDVEAIFAAMRTSAAQSGFGIDDYRKYGYLPADKSGQSVSKTLEYVYDDWCIAMMAKELNKQGDYDEFAKRSLYYANLFDGKTGFMVGKLSNGAFKGEFNPFEVSGDYTEANAWQYNLFVPHDVKGLMNLFGGKDRFTERLDELFVAESKTEGDAPPDISGLVGQYAHGNEPSHHMAYLYNFIGEGYKAQAMLRKIMSELYFAKPDGLSGNEDCGQMSAWYVLSAMGFYPVAPGTNQYAIGSPIFKKVTINLENGKKFVINAPASSDKNMYIQSVKKNGKDYAPAYIVHDDLMSGAEFIFAMGSEPNKNWAAQKEDYPYSFTTTEQASTPYLTSGDMMFLDSTSFAFNCRTEGAKIHYTMDGSEPTENSPVFEGTLTVKATSTVKAKAFKAGYAASPVYCFTAAIAVLQEPAVTGAVKPGLNYEYFEGRFRSAYDLMKHE
ncbi:MAG TPA: GH92 family glycosyl hydrolase, partial [Ignavibacteriales bacterium]|nr:GH92 family glycosyl hydrolase [Ignavibacteriales bacterium]